MMGPVYVVTDAQAPLPVIAQIRAAALGGASLIQLRDKTASDADLAALIANVLPMVTAQGARLIINDRVDLAIRTGVHGLHIGQGDGDPALIRARIGAAMLLGLSVEAEAHLPHISAGVDYLGVGPVRATPSKPDHAPPIGFDGLARIIGGTSLPCYAIGGLKEDDAVAVKAAGAIGMAVVSAVTRTADPQAATRALVKAWRQA
ncbi:thiamine phosphate synthase [Yoonia vestfoldensis]|uniref:Thiamine-phosphate synthase n=1 Tax=Yoonia vestfoldensis TaxID=245188 RepID=A0A1Y0EFA6_9RHOB|nr:thiamine phosphate synthase [Yoonia vestfoldensis]ARU02295.1 thiamine-phosphate synthase [Yoonia vestfoldensis]